jgi:hypothetical protein
LGANQKTGWVSWIHRDPWFDSSIRKQDAAKGGLLRVYIVGGTGRKGIFASHLNQVAKRLSLGS